MEFFHYLSFFVLFIYLFFLFCFVLFIFICFSVLFFSCFITFQWSSKTAIPLGYNGNSMHVWLLLGDIEKAILQISVTEVQSKSCLLSRHLRFTLHEYSSPLSQYFFTSRFLLGATLQHHPELQKPGFEETVRALKENTYVNNLMQMGGDD